MSWGAGRDGGDQDGLAPVPNECSAGESADIGSRSAVGTEEDEGGTSIVVGKGGGSKGGTCSGESGCV